LFESECTAHDLDVMFDLRQNGAVIGVDQHVPGVLEGREQVQRLVEPKVNLRWWIEFWSCWQAADVPPAAVSCPT